MTNAHVWRAAQERLRLQMTHAQFDTWLRGTWLSPSGDATTVLCVHNTFAKEQLELRFRDRIAAAIAEVTGRPCTLKIVVAPDASELSATVVALPALAQQHSGATATSRQATRSAPHAAAHDTVAPRLFELDASAAAAEEPETLSAVAEIAEVAQIAPTRATATASDYGTPGAARRYLPPVAERRRGASGPNSAIARSERVRAAIGRGRSTEAAAATVATELRHEQTPAQPDRAQRQATSDAVEYAEADGGSQRRAGAADAPTRQAWVPRGQRDGSSAMNRQHWYDERDEPEQPEQQPEQSPERAARPLRDARDMREENGAMQWPGERAQSSQHDQPGSPTAANNPYAVGKPRLNPRYTFATFIVGSFNQLAHAASQAVAEAPGESYNPLFLYGGVGLGKTHLLHAIGHTAVERNLMVLYVSSETFTNEIINAIRYRTTEEFRAKYRSVDVLLVDDIQFIAGKESTEEEFFHTFNALHEMNKQIVICSDRPPKAIISLEERLRSRFEWGLIADIQPPDLETRTAILRSKAENVEQDVPNDVINYLASRVQSNIRELEGSFNRLLAYAKLHRLPLTIDTTKQALSSLANDGRQRRVSIADILDAVAEFYHIPTSDLQGKQRDKHIVVPRQIAMYLMRQETEASLLEIGQSLGGRDHSTVLHGCEKISREVNDNTALRKEVLAIRQQLLG